MLALIWQTVSTAPTENSRKGLNTKAIQSQLIITKEMADVPTLADYIVFGNHF